jgi:AcrR family transcriptional regulator
LIKSKHPFKIAVLFIFQSAAKSASMIQATENPGLARSRILRAATDMFVAQGFKGTSIRKICEQANVNVAMVNYYFQSKEELYAAVLDFARQQETKSGTEQPGETGASLSAEEKLGAMIESLVFNLLMPGPSSFFTRLISWELVDPSPAMKIIAENDIRPQHSRFASVIREITGNRLDDATLQKCVFSIIGQAVFYAKARPVHEFAAPEITYDRQGVKQIADHITRFSLAALTTLHQPE